MRFLGSASPHPLGRGRHSTFSRFRGVAAALCAQARGRPSRHKPYLLTPLSRPVCPAHIASSRSANRMVISRGREHRWKAVGGPPRWRPTVPLARDIASRLFSRSTHVTSIYSLQFHHVQCFDQGREARPAQRSGSARYADRPPAHVRPPCWAEDDVPCNAYPGRM